MSKFKILAVLASLIIFVAVIAAFYPVLLQSFTKITTSNSQPQFRGQSEFGKLITSTSGRSEEVSEDVMQKYEGDEQGLENFKYGWGVKKINNDTEWDYKSTPFSGLITAIDPTNGYYNVLVREPTKNNPFLGQTFTIDPSTLCNEGNTYAQYKNRVTAMQKVELNQQSNDETVFFMSFCENAECSSFHRICKYIFLERKKE